VSIYILGIKQTIDAEDHDEQEEKSMSEQEAKQRNRKRTPNNRTTTGFCISALVVGRITTEAFGACEHPSRLAGGRPRVADRDCADAIFYVLRTG